MLIRTHSAAILRSTSKALASVSVLSCLESPSLMQSHAIPAAGLSAYSRPCAASNSTPPPATGWKEALGPWPSAGGAFTHSAVLGARSRV